MLKLKPKPTKDAPKGAAKRAAKPKTAQDFIERGRSWDMDVNGRLRASRNLAWVVAGVAGAVAALALMCLALLLPLKTFEPYVVRVDENTGYTTIVRGIIPGDLSEDEAVTMSNIVKYVTSRETYDPQDLEENYYEVTSMSAGKALGDYVFLWDGSANPDPTPSEEYGFGVQRTVDIKNLSFLSDNTVQVRFRVNVEEAGGRSEEHKVAILTYEYVQRPETLRDRFLNPLGFKVMQYRVDEEII